MKKIYKTYNQIVLIVVLFLFGSCVNDIDLKNISPNIKIDESLVFPIGEVSTSLSEVYNLIGENDYVSIEGDEINVTIRDSFVIKFKGIQIDKNLAPYETTLDIETPVSIVIPPNQILPANNSQHLFDIGYNNLNEVDRLDSVKISGGMIDVRINTENLNVEASDLIVGMIIDNGNSNIEIDISPSVLNDYYQITIPPVVLNTAGRDGILTNFVFKTGSRPITYNPTSKISLEIKYNTLDYDVLYGKFNPAVLTTNLKMVNFDLPLVFDNSLLKFANPKLDITARSNVGAFLSFQINYIEAYNHNNPLQKVTADFNGEKFYNLKFNSRPYVPGDYIEEKMPQLNNTFGKLDQLFDSENYPDRMVYEFSVKSDDVQDGNPDYITPDAHIKLNLNSKIPMYFKEGSYFTLSDSIPNIGPAISSIAKDFSVDTAILVLKVKNGLPMKAKFELVDLKDSLGAPVLQTGFDTEYIIHAASVNTNGLVTSANESILYLKVGKTQFEQLKRMSYMKYKVILAAENSNEMVQFTKNDKFGVKLGLFIKANTTIKLDN